MCVLLGYLVGTLNPAYAFGKSRGMDIRKGGSGNAGASNALLLMGKVTGVICASIDITKAFLVYRLAARIFPGVEAAGVLAGCGCILGHIFPAWMGFSGGKGLACLGGMLLAHNWKLLMILLAGEIVLLAITNYICLVPITGSAAFTAIYYASTEDLGVTLFLAAVSAVIFIKHIPNLRRIVDGSELRVSYLWDKEGERKRILEKHPELEEEFEAAAP